MGLAKDVELCENGANIPLILKNRDEYIRKFIEYHMFSLLIKKQTEALTAGFNKVIIAEQAAFKLFNADELELLLCGTFELVFSHFQENCEYEGGYNRVHKSIKRFWDIVREFDYEQRRLFLKFCTGVASPCEWTEECQIQDSEGGT